LSFPPLLDAVGLEQAKRWLENWKCVGAVLEEDQILFVDLGPAEGRGERVITALGRAYSTLDSPCIIVDRTKAFRQSRATG